MPASNTLKTEVAFGGIGLHTGAECRVVIRPASVGTGIKFLTPSGEIPAVSENVVSTERGTVLGLGEARISTVEHILSALVGMGIDDAEIEVTGPEIPVCDGSALPFVELIETAGIEVREAERWHIEVTEPVWVSGDGGRYVVASAGDPYRITGIISFQHPMIGEQSGSFQVDPETYKMEIAPARTFCTSDEVRGIMAKGLGKGGNDENVVIVEEKGYSSPLRYGDEFLRHKILDLIGDLALVGRRLRAHVFAIKSGHTLNVALAARIRELCESLREGG